MNKIYYGDNKEERKILYVCKGNVCRSPMAEYISKNITSNYRNNNIVFNSRGIDVSCNNPAEINAIKVCKSHGIDLSNHMSKMLQYDDVIKHEIIIAMEYSQIKYLESAYESESKKFYLLKYFYGNKLISIMNPSIKDPYGLSIDNFEKCYNEIYRCVHNMLGKLFNIYGKV